MVVVPRWHNYMFLAPTSCNPLQLGERGRDYIRDMKPVEEQDSLPMVAPVSLSFRESRP